MPGAVDGDSIQRRQVIPFIAATDIIGRGAFHAGGDTRQRLDELDGIRLAHRGCRPVQIGRVDADDRHLRAQPPRLYDGRIDPLIPLGVLGGKSEGEQRKGYGKGGTSHQNENRLL